MEIDFVGTEAGAGEGGIIAIDSSFALAFLQTTDIILAQTAKTKSQQVSHPADYHQAKLPVSADENLTNSKHNFICPVQMLNKLLTHFSLLSNNLMEESPNSRPRLA